MTLTFESDNDVIVYVLETIISYARKNRYIFVAQSIWWIASDTGLTEGLVSHIDNLRIRSEVPVGEFNRLSASSELPFGKEVVLPKRFDKKPPVDITRTELQKEYCDKVVSREPRDTQEETRNEFGSPSLHPDRISQVDNSVNTNHLDIVLKDTGRFLQESHIQRKRFDPLQRTRQGKVQPRKLAKGERKRLNC